MIRQALSFGGLLLLAGATALATPGSALAQRGGGGHAGGAHFGGAHFGGAGFGGFRGRSFNGPARFGGFRSSHYETFDVGRDGGAPVSADYEAPNPFTGVIDEVTIDLMK